MSWKLINILGKHLQIKYLELHTKDIMKTGLRGPESLY